MPMRSGSGSVLLDKIFRSVDLVAEIFSSHVAIDRRAPVAPVARTAAVVHVENRVTLLHQKVMEHVFAEILRPPAMHVLQVAGAVHEDHSGLGRVRLRRNIEPGGYCDAIARGDLDQFRFGPGIVT